jgi:hypothetical protein
VFRVVRRAGCAGGASTIFYEAEGSDRSNATLAAESLLKAVAAAAAKMVAGPRRHKVVLLLLNAGAVELGWAKASEQVGAILHSSFPGKKTCLFAPFKLNDDYFTKTGSGQI